MLFVGLGAVNAAPKFHKQELKVLYVGYRPDMPIPDFGTVRRTAEQQSDYKTRMGAFQTMLEKYFTDVQTVDARDYSEEMSRKVDVTIFDALPKPVKEAVVEVDRDFGSVYFKESGVYLSEDFDSPSVFVGYVADEIGHSLGLKLDWFCLCLRHHALNIQTEHPIFHGPFQVDITLEQRPTPEDVYKYTQNWWIPREIPMWRVQEDRSRIGMVAGWYGLNEGDDAEFISGGHNMKSYENMAIGRHANFFMWGFGAAPDSMTEEAQTVFANAVSYIKDFAGRKPVVRRFGYPLMRKKIEDFRDATTKEGYQKYLQGVKIFNNWLPKQQKKVRRMKNPTPQDKAWLDEKPMEALSHVDFIKENSQFGLINAYHNDVEAVRCFLDENMEYFYGSDLRKQDLEIDEDAKSLGISNRDKHLLDSCITMLEKGVDTDKAMRLLKRYTYQDFPSATAWRNWYKTYKDKLYFTEVGNYKFMGDGSICVKPMAEETEKSAEEVEPVKVDRDVVFQVEVTGHGDTRELQISLHVKEGFHIYAESGDDCPMQVTTLSFTLPSGVELLGNLVKPEAIRFAGETNVYEHKVVFTQQIKITDKNFKEGEIVCTLDYQCCNSDICKPAQQEKHKIKILGN